MLVLHVASSHARTMMCKQDACAPVRLTRLSSCVRPSGNALQMALSACCHSSGALGSEGCSVRAMTRHLYVWLGCVGALAHMSTGVRALQDCRERW